MRVLLTTDTVGGVWTYTRVLTAGLLEHGHSVALVSFGGAPSSDQLAWCLRTQHAAGTNFRYVPSEIPLEWMPDNHLALEHGFPLLQQVASEFRPDLLHSNQFCFGSIDVDRPRLVVAHSDVLSWAAACTSAGLPASVWLDQYCELVQNGLNGADALVAPTYAMLQAAATHFVLPPQQRVIANGRSLPAPVLSAPRARQAITAGRMEDPSKNLAALTAIQACPLLVAGSSPHSSQSPSHASTVKLLGVLSEAELFDLFRSSRIYIAASLYEPFGLAPLEAALCGCALVAHDIPSLREVWGAAALYFRSSAELEQHLLSLLADDALFAHRQSLALERAHAFSANTMTTNYLNLYTNLLGACSAQTPGTPVCTYVH